MSSSFNTNASADSTDVWLTPKSLLDRLGHFDVDPCAAVNRPWDCATKNYTIEDDGLKQDWGKGRVWCNPPYGSKAEAFMEKLSKHPGMGLALVFARTDTKWFQKCILGEAKYILFIKGRLKFHCEDGSTKSTANAASCLVAWDSREYALLAKLAQEGLGSLWCPTGADELCCETCMFVEVDDKTQICKCTKKNKYLLGSKKICEFYEK